MKKKTLAWCAREIKTGEIWPLWIARNKKTIQQDIKGHRFCGRLKVIRVEIKEVKRKK